MRCATRGRSWTSVRTVRRARRAAAGKVRVASTSRVAALLLRHRRHPIERLGEGRGGGVAGARTGVGVGIGTGVGAGALAPPAARRRGAAAVWST